MIRRKSLAFTLVAAVLLAGCNEQAVRKDAIEAAEEIRVAPERAPNRTVTSFTPALRCMDNTFMMYGIRDVVVISEDIEDRTEKVSAGTKDMLISAVSEMTKRSRAVRLIAFGNDSGNLISYMQQQESKGLFQLTPQYGIRGSISQLDENVAKKTEGAGLAIDPFFGIGGAATAAISILGLDLTMVSTRDLTVVPGVSSNNSVSIIRSGAGTEAEAGYKKFGINYQMNLSRSEGMSQALRNLVNLAVVELFGKLTQVPYWTCLGGAPDDPTVAQEISDWFQAMVAYPPEFIAYWQNQMRIRGLYAGEVNGTPDPGLSDAVTAYREALGLEKNAKLNLEFFTAYLSANHYDVAPKAFALLQEYQNPSAQTVAKALDDSPISLSLTANDGRNIFRRGESIVLNVKPSRDAFLYCFMQDENRAIMRFYPNRFAKDAFVPARGLQLPKGSEFAITANSKGVREHIVCFAANHDVFAELPPSIGAGDFEALQVSSLDALKQAFMQAGGSSVGVAEIPVVVR